MAPTSTVSQHNIMDDRGLQIRQTFLEFPGENLQVDYKDGIRLTAGDEFSLKLVKHILGMSNAGGGYIVIGYKENEAKQPQPISNLDKAVLSSYDPSTLAQLVEKYTAGSDKVDLMVHKDQHPKNGHVYPIIQINGFVKRPYFCKSSAGGILEEGALYLRVASARTIKIATPDDWDSLIDLCVSRRQDETLKRFAILIGDLGVPFPDKKREEPSGEINKWLLETQEAVKNICLTNSYAFEGLELSHWLLDRRQKWNSTELLKAAEEAVRSNTGWPIGVILHRPEYRPKPQRDGVEVSMPIQGHGVDYWYLRNDGSYYFFRSFGEDQEERRPRQVSEKGRVFFFDTRIWRIAECVDHTIALYKALNVSPEDKIVLSIKHIGIQDRQLTASDPMRSFTMHERSASAPQAEWSRELTLDLLQTERNNIIVDIAKTLIAFFDFWEPDAGVIEGVIQQFDQSRVRH